MNTLTDGYWEAERKRMMRARRKAKARLMADAIANALLALAAIALVVLFCWWAGTRETRERAAWNEGYYGVDRATALAMAERGIGRTSDDVLNYPLSSTIYHLPSTLYTLSK